MNYNIYISPFHLHFLIDETGAPRGDLFAEGGI